MLKERIYFERKKAILITADFSGPIEGYAMAWLKLTNNAREYRNMIWKIENGRGNNVYVICNPKSVDSVKEFLDGIYGYYDSENDKMIYIGKVVNEEEIVVGVPIYEYSSTYKDDYEWEEDMDKSISYWLPMEEEFV